MKTLIFALLFTAIGGCNSIGNDTSGTKQIETLCTSAAASLETLAVYKDKLSVSEIKTVTDAADTLTPVCGDRDTVPTYDTAKKEAIEAAVARLRNLVLLKELK